MSAQAILWISFALGLFICAIILREGARQGMWRGTGLAALSILCAGLLTAESAYLAETRAVQTFVIALTVFSSLIALVVYKRGGSRVSAGWMFLPAGLSFYLFLVNAARSEADELSLVFARVVPAVLWFFYVLFIASSRIRMSHLGIVASSLMALTAILAPFSGDVVRECDVFKCGVFGYIYTGAFPSENFLAQTAGVVLIVCLFTCKGLLRVGTVVLCVFTLSAATSRTAIVAIAIAIAIGMLSSIVSLSFSRLIMVVFVIATSLLSVFLIYSSQSHDFSNRGRVWEMARAVLGDNLVLGLGIDSWARYQSIGLLPALFAHNQMLLLLFAGGVLAVAGYVILLLWLAVVSAKYGDVRPTSHALIGYLGMGGLLEVVWNPSTVDGSSIAMFMLVAAVYAGVRSNRASPTTVGNAIAQGDVVGRARG